MATTSIRHSRQFEPQAIPGAIRSSRRHHHHPPPEPPPAPSRAKSGCWTCRLRRKKCDEQRQNGTCQTCLRLKIDCLGWGAKRPEWLRHKDQVDAYKNQIKNQLAHTNAHRPSRPSPRASTANKTSALEPPTPTQESALLPEPEVPSGGSIDSESDANDDFLPQANHDSSIYEHLISPGVLAGADYSSIQTNTATPYTTFDTTTTYTPYTSVNPQHAFSPYSSALSIPAPTGMIDPSTLQFPMTLGGQTFEYKARIRHFVPVCERGQTSAHVFYYFSRVRAMQYCFGGDSVTEVMHDILVREPYGVVSNAICALASVHNNLLRQSRGLEADDLSSDDAPARQFYSLAFSQMCKSKQRNGRYNEVDATAALHFVSYWLFNGGSGDWQTALSIAGDWLASSDVSFDGDPAAAIQSLNNTGKFAAKTIIWFDIFSAVTLLRPPRFLPMYKKLFRSGAGFWAAGLQMEMVMGADDATILAMAEIAELAAWKEEQRKSASLSTMELSRRAAAIEEELRLNTAAAPWPLDAATLAQLNAAFDFHTAGADFGNLPPSFDMPVVVVNPFSVSTSASDPASCPPPAVPVNDAELRRRATNVFREGALLYLHTVISGCNPNVPEIIAAVTATKDTLAALVPSDVDRSLVFPICLAGCLANDPATHTYFRDRLAGHQGVGNCSQAVQLMDAVWDKRQQSSGQTTCWRATMQELGLNLLLV